MSNVGEACRTDDVEGMKKRVGSPGYCAPEIVMGRQYNEKVGLDMTFSGHFRPFLLLFDAFQGFSRLF